jgi:predicted SAM-dependent methyltransferase
MSRFRFALAMKSMMRQARWEVRAAVASTLAASVLQKCRQRRELDVHLGCGSDIRAQWINIDVSSARLISTISDDGTVFLNHDLRRGLPLAPNSCRRIYSSHFFEHVERETCDQLLRDCHTALRRGGELRLALPDFAAAFRAYTAGDKGYFEMLDTHGVVAPLSGRTGALIEYIHYFVYQWGEHRTLFDREVLELLLRRAGFTSVEPAEFDPQIDVDNALRRSLSLYTLARKL